MYFLRFHFKMFIQADLTTKRCLFFIRQHLIEKIEIDFFHYIFGLVLIKRSYFFLKLIFLTSKLTFGFCWRGTESRQNLLKASISRSSSSMSPLSKSMSFGAKMLSGMKQIQRNQTTDPELGQVHVSIEPCQHDFGVGPCFEAWHSILSPPFNKKSFLACFKTYFLLNM